MTRVSVRTRDCSPVAWLPWSALLLTLLTLMGCSLSKPYPAKLTYLLEAKRPGSAVESAARRSTVLQIQTLQIAAPYEGKAFVHRLSDLRYESDFYHEFLVAPRTLVTEQTRQWLAAASLFRAVVGPESRVDSSLALNGNIHALYADFRDSSSPQAVLEVEYILLDQTTSAAVFQKRYRQETALKSKAPEDLAMAWSSGLAKVLEALEKDLARELPK